MLAKFILVITLVLALPSGVLAETVGHFTKVEGRVEILKGGKLPATEVKAQEAVEPKDIVRTKSLSRAQITFIDNTTVTLSPDCRFAIEEYSFDAAQKKRSAVMQLFQGLAYFVVSQVFKVQEPDFIVKTHTAVMGVRGTEVGIRLTPNESTFLNFHGLVRVGNIFPEVGGALPRAEKIAFSFGNKFVDLQGMEGSVVPWDLPPTLPFKIFQEDRDLFMQQLRFGLMGRQAPSNPPGTGPLSQVDHLPGIVSPVAAELLQTAYNNITIPPPLVTQSTESFSFFQTFGTGYFSLTSSSMTSAVFTGSIMGSRSVAYPGSFLALFSLTATTSPSYQIFPSVDSGSFYVSSNSANVTGRPGGILVGSMSLNAVASGYMTSTYFNLTGPVAISPGGGLVFRPGGTFTTYSESPYPVSGIVTAGNWVQQPSMGASLRPGAVRPQAVASPASQTQILGPALVRTPTSH